MVLWHELLYKVHDMAQREDVYLMKNNNDLRNNNDLKTAMA